MTEPPERTTSGAAKRLALVTLLAGILIALLALLAPPASAAPILHPQTRVAAIAEPNGQFVGPSATVAAVQGRERAPNYDRYATGSSVAAETGTGAGTDIVPYEPYPSNGGFLGQPVEDTLETGTRISRFGEAGGRYASPEDVPFSQRGLSPAAANGPYTVYEVAKPVEVEGGIAQYWMGGGGGVQYRFAQPIQQLVDDGVLKVVGP
jgi:Tuberculosis necrotizing toxin